MSSFRKVLDHLMVDIGINQKELAQLANISTSYVTLLLSGKRENPSKKVIESLAEALNLDEENRKQLYISAGYPINNEIQTQKSIFKAHTDTKSNTPNHSKLYGREKTLSEIKKWISINKARVISIFGIGGVGKTTVASEIANQYKNKYNYILWTSLLHAPTLRDILVDWINTITRNSIELPEDVNELLTLFSSHLEKKTCLIILDNFDSILQAKSHQAFLHGYENYSNLINIFAEMTHSNCLLITSREKPEIITTHEITNKNVYSKNLPGLGVEAGKKLLEARGVIGKENHLKDLIELYSGNPLALILISNPICTIFGGNIENFLQENAFVFGSLRSFLEKYFSRLTELEKNILFWMAINREPAKAENIYSYLVPTVANWTYFEAIQSLQNRFLIEGNPDGSLKLQPVILEYLTNKIEDQIYREICDLKIMMLKSHALLNVRSTGYVQELQIKYLLKPITNRLLSDLRIDEIEDKFSNLIDVIKKNPNCNAGYSAGNLINTLLIMNIDLDKFDFSNLIIKGADLANKDLQNVNFTNSDLSGSFITSNFSSILSISTQNDKVIFGDTSGKIHIFKTEGLVPLLDINAHDGWINSVVIDPKGKIVASGGGDKKIKVWDIQNGILLNTFSGHEKWISKLAFHPHEDILISGSGDNDIKMWDIISGKCLRTFSGHQDRITDILFSNDGKSILSCSTDKTIINWEIDSGRILFKSEGHSDAINTIALSPDGTTIASAGNDSTIRLWDINNGNCIKSKSCNTERINSITFGNNGQTLICGGVDGCIRIWDIVENEYIKNIHGHQNWINSIVLNKEKEIMFSGGEDCVLKSWDSKTMKNLRVKKGYSNGVRCASITHKGELLAIGGDDNKIRIYNLDKYDLENILHGHSDRIWSVCYSCDANQLASASHDKTIRLWNTSNGESIAILRGHKNKIRSVAFSPNGRYLASCGDDKEIKVWDAKTKILHGRLLGHTGRIRSVTFDPTSELLASCSDDRTIRVWKVDTGELIQCFSKHSDWVRTIIFTPNSKTIISGTDDSIIHFWDIATGEESHPIQSDSGRIWSIAIHPKEKLLITGNGDSTIRIWDFSSRECTKTLRGHSGQVFSVVINTQKNLIVSTGEDGTAKLWDMQNYECKTIQIDRPYEGMKITGIKGLTGAQIQTMRTLGGII